MAENDAPLSDQVASVIRAFAMADDETQGHLTVEINTDGRPVEAFGFADTIKDTVRVLNSLDESKKLKWAIIEANVIGDRASFTLKAYSKQLFKVQRNKQTKEPKAAP